MCPGYSSIWNLGVYWQRYSFYCLGQERPLKEQLDNQQNAEVQRERYYVTIHKVALQANSDKIPGNICIDHMYAHSHKKLTHFSFCIILMNTTFTTLLLVS